MIGCVVFIGFHCRIGGVVCKKKKNIHAPTNTHLDTYVCGICARMIMHTSVLMPRPSSELLCGYMQGSRAPGAFQPLNNKINKPCLCEERQKSERE